jgi:transcriptional regulator with GAF, ATPase, and Fis domain
VMVPPLPVCREDIPALAAHFVDTFSRLMGKLSISSGGVQGTSTLEKCFHGRHCQRCPLTFWVDATALR